MLAILIGKHLAVDGDLWDAHPGHEAPVPPHPKRCSIGLRSGDCGGHFSTGNSLSCSRNQFEMIQAL